MAVPGDDALQAICDNDLADLARLIAKYPIAKGDSLWMGLLLSDFMGHLSPEGTALLLAAGLDVNYRDDGFYPLHVAIDRHEPIRHALVEVLLKGGADPNLHGFNDWTALHRAAVNNPTDFTTLALLLDHGADPAIETNIDNYATAAEEALSFNYRDTADFIETYTPKPKV